MFPKRFYKVSKFTRVLPSFKKFLNSKNRRKPLRRGIRNQIANNIQTFGSGSQSIYITRNSEITADVQQVLGLNTVVGDSSEWAKISEDFKYFKLGRIALIFWPRSSSYLNTTPMNVILNWNGVLTEYPSVQDNVRTVPPFFTRTKILRYQVPKISIEGSPLNYWMEPTNLLSILEFVRFQFSAPGNTSKWDLRIEVQILCRGPTNKSESKKIVLKSKSPKQSKEEKEDERYYNECLSLLKNKLKEKEESENKSDDIEIVNSISIGEEEEEQEIEKEDKEKRLLLGSIYTDTIKNRLGIFEKPKEDDKIEVAEESEFIETKYGGIHKHELDKRIRKKEKERRNQEKEWRRIEEEERSEYKRMMNKAKQECIKYQTKLKKEKEQIEEENNNRLDLTLFKNEEKEEERRQWNEDELNKTASYFTSIYMDYFKKLNG